jgi:hypothetical protein
VRAVAIRNSLVGLFPPARSAEIGNDPVAGVREAHQFRSSLDRDAEILQSLDQEALMLVLREDFQKRIGGQILPDGLEGESRRRSTLDPQIRGGRSRLRFIGVRQPRILWPIWN